jgi:hypothetical protein
MEANKKERKRFMFDTHLAGARCRATRGMRSHRGLIERSTEGTIQHDIDNLGRHLISVQWDIGITDYVFPSEIEIIGKDASTGCGA